MDLQLIGTLGGLGAFIAVVFAALRYQREDAGQVVQQQSTVLADQQLLNDELKDTLEACRTERTRLETELEQLQSEHREMTSKFRQVEANLRACVHEQQRLERRLIALGEDPSNERH